ncbi:MAG: hypothetical protein ACRD8Z_12465, partial [Nitrososphaeraceae archaeon]
MTFHQYFKEKYIFGEFIDHTIISLSFLIWALFSLRSRIYRLTIFLVIAAAFAVGIVSGPSNVLETLSLITLPVITITAVLARLQHRTNLAYSSFKLTINYLLISIVILSILSLLVSASSSEINDPYINMFILLSRFSPVVMFLLVLSLPLKIIFNYIYRNVPWIRNRFQNNIESFESVHSETTTKTRYNRTLLLLGLASTVILSVIVVLIPNIDDFGGPIGEDTLIYVDWIEDLRASSNLDQISHRILVEIQGGDRPISLLLIYLMSLVIPSTTITTIELVLPVLLAPALVIATYFLTRELTSNALIALFACFLTAISFQIIAGMY